jgi:hypothetical protein
MASIEYIYSHYRFQGRFDKPLSVQQYHNIKIDQKQFFQAMKLAINNEFFVMKSSYKISATFYVATKGLLIAVLSLGLASIIFASHFSESLKSAIGEILAIVAMVMSITLIASLSYWRTRRQFNIYKKSIERYYAIHAHLAIEASDYEKYILSVYEKKEYFNALAKQRAFYESQQI